MAASRSSKTTTAPRGKTTAKGKGSTKGKAAAKGGQTGRRSRSTTPATVAATTEAINANPSADPQPENLEEAQAQAVAEATAITETVEPQAAEAPAAEAPATEADPATPAKAENAATRTPARRTAKGAAKGRNSGTGKGANKTKAKGSTKGRGATRSRKPPPAPDTAPVDQPAVEPESTAGDATEISAADANEQPTQTAGQPTTSPESNPPKDAPADDGGLRIADEWVLATTATPEQHQEALDQVSDMLPDLIGKMQHRRLHHATSEQRARDNRTLWSLLQLENDILEMRRNPTPYGERTLMKAERDYPDDLKEALERLLTMNEAVYGNLMAEDLTRIWFQHAITPGNGEVALSDMREQWESEWPRLANEPEIGEALRYELQVKLEPAAMPPRERIRFKDGRNIVGFPNVDYNPELGYQAVIRLAMVKMAGKRAREAAKAG